MTKSDKYNELRSRINKHCPELLELGWGCKVRYDFRGKMATYTVAYSGITHRSIGGLKVDMNEYAWIVLSRFGKVDSGTTKKVKVSELGKILGHPPQLQHVLRAVRVSLHSKMPHRYGIDDLGRFIAIFGYGVDEHCELRHIGYNLSLQLSEQEEIVLDFLLEIIV